MAKKKENGAAISAMKESAKKAINKRRATKLSTAQNEWETKKGAPFQFDADYAVEIMEKEIADYLQSRHKEGAYWEMLPTNDNGGVALRGKPFMTVGVIALMCGVDTNTLLAHVNDKNEDGSLKNAQLFGSYQRFKELSKIRLIEGGASGAYSPNFVSFVGNVNYGMIPKQQVEQSVEIKSMDQVYKQLDDIHHLELERVEKQRQEMLERKKRLDAMVQE